MLIVDMKNFILLTAGIFLFLVLLFAYALYDLDHGGDKRDAEQMKLAADYNRAYEKKLHETDA